MRIVDDEIRFRPLPKGAHVLAAKTKSGLIEVTQKECSKLERLIETLTSDTALKKRGNDLYSGPMDGANNAWTPGRWAEAAGPSHFRSASKYIRSAIKNDAG